MKSLSHLVRLFEEDPSFWKEWKEAGSSAVRRRGISLTEEEGAWLNNFINGLRGRKHITKQSKLFGM